ncbi:MAG: hypothetical protein U0790_24120 [Isosphaeraceae bacterium]
MMRRSMSRRFALLASFTLCLVSGIPAGRVSPGIPSRSPRMSRPPGPGRPSAAEETAKEPERVVKTLEQKQLTHGSSWSPG